MAFTRWETTTFGKGGQQQGGQRQGGQQQGGQTSVQQQATPAQQQATWFNNVMFCHATPATRYPVQCGSAVQKSVPPTRDHQRPFRC